MNKTPPILYIVDPSIAVTGAFIAARNTARLLKDVAHVVLVLPEGSSIPAAELGDFWRVDYLPFASLSKKLATLVHYLPALIAGARQLRRALKRDRATRLQLNDFYLMHGVLLRLLGCRGRIVSWVRCHPARFAGPLAAPMLWLAQRSATQLVAVSHAIRELLPDTATPVLYDSYEGRTRASRLWEPTEEKRLVYVGNYIAGKGQDLAIEAFAQIAAKEATLRLAFHGGEMGLGKNTAYRERLAQRVAQLGLSDRVTFHGFVADPYTVLEGAYAALNFSTAESFSLTVLEASGAGVPVIATASGGPQEIIKDGVSGYLVPVGDVPAAAERLLQLARQPDKARAMGDAGATRVRTQFSPQHLRAQLLALWELND